MRRMAAKHRHAPARAFFTPAVSCRALLLGADVYTALALLLLWAGAALAFIGLVVPAAFAHLPGSDLAWRLRGVLLKRLDLAAFIVFGLALLTAHPQDEWWDFDMPAEHYPARSWRRAYRWFRNNW